MKQHAAEGGECTVVRALADLRANTVSIDEAAELLGKSAPAVRVAVARGRIPAIHVGRAVLIPRASVAQLLDEHGRADFTRHANEREHPRGGRADRLRG